MFIFYFRISADRVEVLAGQIDINISKEQWIHSSVSKIYVHEHYSMGNVYNDIALLEVSTDTLGKIIF